LQDNCDPTPNPSPKNRSGEFLSVGTGRDLSARIADHLSEHDFQDFKDGQDYLSESGFTET
jgi:hypothetical protein